MLLQILTQCQQALMEVQEKSLGIWAWHIDLFEQGFSLEEAFLLMYDHEGVCHQVVEVTPAHPFAPILEELYTQYGAFSVRTNQHSGYAWNPAIEMVVQKDPNVAFSPFRNDWNDPNLQALAALAQHLMPWPFENRFFRLKLLPTSHERMNLEARCPHLQARMEESEQCQKVLPWYFYKVSHGIFLMLPNREEVSHPVDFYPFS